MGVQGIQVPHISDARAAREAVKAVRYAPLGDRGMAGASRASDYGVIPMREHLERSNREITLAVMVEDLPALAEIDAIAADRGRRHRRGGTVGHVARARRGRHIRPSRSSSTSSIGSRRRCRRAASRGSRCR